jgi:hypothetical protein
MKLLRRLSFFALLFALLALVSGFTVLTLPRTADASRCDCWCMYCTVEEPIYCWEQCCKCPTFP